MSEVDVTGAAVIATNVRRIIGQEWCTCPSERTTGDMIKTASLGPEVVVLCQVTINESTGEVVRKPMLRSELNKADIGPVRV